MISLALLSYVIVHTHMYMYTQIGKSRHFAACNWWTAAGCCSGDLI